MYCSKCGVQNSDGSTHCTDCGSVLTDDTESATGSNQTNAGQTKPKSYGLAIIALVLGVLLMLFLPVIGFPMVICGTISLIKTGQGQVRKGKVFAFVGILMPVVLILLMMPLMPLLGRVESIAQHVVCKTNLESLSNAMLAYTNSYDDMLPIENWCDLLMEKEAVQPKNFVCPDSDDIEWESSFAMNKHITGMKMGDIPPNVVLFFETDMGLESGSRNISIRTRKHFDWNYDEVVYKDRFNQLGGSEDLVYSHTSFFGRLGCNIAFADGHVEFVTEDRIGELQWTTEE